MSNDVELLKNSILGDPRTEGTFLHTLHDQLNKKIRKALQKQNENLPEENRFEIPEPPIPENDVLDVLAGAIAEAIAIALLKRVEIEIKPVEVLATGTTTAIGKTKGSTVYLTLKTETP